MNFKLPSNSGQYDDLIKKYATQYGLDFNLAKALVWQESSFNPKARSGADARGLTQIVPRWHPEYKGDWYDPETNLAYGLKYLKSLLTRYKGNTSLALAAYNAGMGNVDKYGGKIPPFKETQDYVKNILGRKEILDGKKKCSQCGRPI